MRGEVIVELFTDRTHRLDPGTRLQSERGELEVVASRPHQHRWIVAFQGVASREQAEALHGLVLRADFVDDGDELWVHELVGSDVRTTTGELAGRCVAVQANPASDLLELDTGALVPVVFVVDRGPGYLIIEPPEGLLDL